MAELTIAEVRELLNRADEGELAALERSLAADERKGVKSALASARRRIDLEKAEEARVGALYGFERSMLPKDLLDGVIVGLDEVGRGAVAGPLAVGAVVLPAVPQILGLDDSKKLSPERREAVAADIKQHALTWTVAYIEPARIDRDGMSASLRAAFSEAINTVESFGIKADLVLVDGNPLGIDKREKNVVKGDAKCASIAAASIVAKVERDALMRGLAEAYPEYGFSQNKGYASQEHVEAIRQHGLSGVHRRSFCKSFMQESLF